jgi:hypothetical protein
MRIPSKLTNIHSREFPAASFRQLIILKADNKLVDVRATVLDAGFSRFTDKTI